MEEQIFIYALIAYCVLNLAGKIPYKAERLKKEVKSIPICRVGLTLMIMCVSLYAYIMLNQEVKSSFSHESHFLINIFFPVDADYNGNRFIWIIIACVTLTYFSLTKEREWVKPENFEKFKGNLKIFSLIYVVASAYITYMFVYNIGMGGNRFMSQIGLNIFASSRNEINENSVTGAIISGLIMFAFATVYVRYEKDLEKKDDNMPVENK